MVFTRVMAQLIKKGVGLLGHLPLSIFFVDREPVTKRTVKPAQISRYEP